MALYGKNTEVKNKKGLQFYEYDRVKVDGKIGTVCYRQWPRNERIKPWILLDRMFWKSTKPEFIQLTEDAEILNQNNNENKLYEFVKRYDYHVEQLG